MVRERRISVPALGVGVMVAVFAVLVGPWSGAVGAAPLSVGVVEFAAFGPQPILNYVIPSSTATDQLTALLTQAAGGTVTVIPGSDMRRAEAGLRWQSEDTLSFARLGDLAHAVGADRLVLGRLPIVGTAGGGNEPPQGTKNGNGTTYITADVVVQIFDAHQGRIVAETESSGSSISGPVAALGTIAMLRNALAPTVPWLLAHLSETAGGTSGGSRALPSRARAIILPSGND